MTDTAEARRYMLFRLLLSREVKLPSLHCVGARACVRVRMPRASVCAWTLSQIGVSTSAAAFGARVHRAAANSGLFPPLLGWLRSKVGAEGENRPTLTHGHQLSLSKSAGSLRGVCGERSDDGTLDGRWSLGEFTFISRVWDLWEGFSKFHQTLKMKS